MISRQTYHDISKFIYRKLHPTEEYWVRDSKAIFDFDKLRGRDNDFLYDYYTERDLIGEVCCELDGDTVFWDVGACFGIYTAFASDIARRVHAFEPHPKAFEILCRTAELNGSPSIHRIALGDNTGEISIKTDGSTAHTVSDEGEFTAQSYRATDLLDERLSQTPDVMKIDVEGVEGDVIRGFGDRITEVNVIFLEVHPEKLLGFGTTEEEVLNDLCDRGFEKTHLQSRLVEKHFRFDR